MSSNTIGEKKQVTAYIKWFSPFRGYGFVTVDGIEEDIFLHFSTVDQIGHKFLEEGDKILCEIYKGPKGYHVEKIINIIEHSTKTENQAQISTVEGKMKWFNPAKGYGFAQTIDGEEDVFIHASLLRKLGVPSIDPGKKLLMKIQKSNRGREALEIMLL